MTKRAKPNRWSMGKPVLPHLDGTRPSLVMRMVGELVYRGIKVEVLNHGHHWILTRGRHKIEWWPSTRKLVVDQRYNDGLEVADAFQMAIAAHHVLVDGGKIGKKFIARWTKFRRRIRTGAAQ